MKILKLVIAYSMFLALLGCSPSDAEKAAQNLGFETNGILNKFVGDQFTNPAIGLGTGVITYTSSDLTSATVSSAGTVTILKAGQTTITATITESEKYKSATATYTIDAVKNDQIVTFDSGIATELMVGDSIQLSATSLGRLPVTFSSADPSIAIVNSATLTANSTGTVTITAEVAENNAFLAGKASIDILVVEKTYTLSGTVYTTPGSQVDSDVNHPLADYISNDAFADAQIIYTPTVLNGFASAVGFGEPGARFESSGDLKDIYAAPLIAGQTIILKISDTTADLDLYLYSENDTVNPIKTSLNATDVDSITIDSTGNYYISVVAVNGATNYSLSIGNIVAPPAALLYKLTAESDFVPFEIIAEFNKPISSEPVPALGALSTTEVLPAELTIVSGANGRPFKIALQKKLNPTGSIINSAIHPSATSKNSELADKIETILLLKKVMANENVKSASLNYVSQPMAVSDNPNYVQQWHYQNISTPLAWSSSDGSGVVVAVIDTGVFMNHSDLQCNLTNTGYDFISDINRANDGDGIDNNPDDSGDDLDPTASSYHGTHVAGTIAACNNSEGGLGVAYNASIMPIRVLGIGGGTDYDVIQAIRYAAGLSNDSGAVPAKKADIINMSLGSLNSYNATFQQAIIDVRNVGVIIIASAGNDTTDEFSYPASYDGVVSVSATRQDNTLSYYSNFGSAIDVAAPGGDVTKDQNLDSYPDGVFSTFVSVNDSGTRTSTFAPLQGTSMASPHVAAVAALMKSVAPNMTPLDFDNALIGGKITSDLPPLNGPQVRDSSFGYGLIDAKMAVDYALLINAIDPLPSFIATSTPEMAFLNIQTKKALNIRNGGEESLYVTEVSTDKSWLLVTPSSVDANNLGSYDVEVDRGTMAPGVYTANILVQSDTAPDFSIPVKMIINSVPLNIGNNGFNNIYLYDAITNEWVDGISLNAVNGTYGFSMTGVHFGSYTLKAGSNMDYNNFYCGLGESCGWYPSLMKADIILLDKDLSELNFYTSYDDEYGVFGTAAQRP